VIRDIMAVALTLLLCVCTAHAQRPIEVRPAVPAVPTIPAPMPSLQLPAPSLGTTPGAVQIAPPPPPPKVQVEQHPHAAEMCDCYRRVYDQQGRWTRVFNGRSPACCP
jgi:hypothetical protein